MRKSSMRGRGFASLFLSSSTWAQWGSPLWGGRSFTSLFYQQLPPYLLTMPEFYEEVLPYLSTIPEYSGEVLYEGEELHLPFFISKNLSSMRKLLHEGEKLHLPFFSSKYLSSMRSPPWGEELNLPFFISNYLYSMRKSFVRKKLHISFLPASPWVQWGSPPWGGGASPPIFFINKPEFNEEVLHKGEELNLPFLSASTWAMRKLLHEGEELHFPFLSGSTWGSPPWGVGASQHRFFLSTIT